MKIISILFVVSLILQSCNLVDSNLNNELSIQTEKTSYTIQNEFSSKILITNNLNKDIRVFNSSCGGPSFTLESHENGKWIIEVEQPICDAIPKEPLLIKNGEKKELSLSIAVSINTLSGLYRMKFNITENDKVTLLEEKYLISNTFEIIKQ